MQGMSVVKPHGYAGDFEMIDRIYTRWLSPDDHLRRWDEYFHAQAAARAVRNRMGVFHHVLDQHVGRRQNNTCTVLNLGSGPGRCLAAWLNKNPDRRVQVDCVDYDADAIAYARTLNEKHLDRVAFLEENVVRLQPQNRYDLIWSSGLFDYFTLLFQS